MSEKYKKAAKGLFRPKNPRKYEGDPTKIIYRSGLEKTFLRWLDTNPKVISYSSEEAYVLYFDPIRQKTRRYFYDAKVVIQDPSGERRTYLVEVKSKSETVEPKRKTRMTKGYVYSVTTWVTNNAKWNAAKKLCEERGWYWRLITEENLKKLG